MKITNVINFRGALKLTLDRQHPNVVDKNEAVIEARDIIREQIHNIASRCLCSGSL